MITPQRNEGTLQCLCQGGLTAATARMARTRMHNDHDVCSVLAALLVPTPSEEDFETILQASKQEQQWQERQMHQEQIKEQQLQRRPSCGRRQLLTFVVNHAAGDELCSILDPATFRGISRSVQLGILSFMRAGLHSDTSSAVRLRLSCEGDQLISRLLVLIEVLSLHDEAKNALREEESVLSMLGEVLGMVSCAGVDVSELKGLLNSFRASPVAALAALASLRNTSVQRLLEADEARVDDRAPVVRSMVNFDGTGSGMILPSFSWPFAHEYQLAAWVRVERSKQHSMSAGKAPGKRAHLFTISSHTGAGFDYILEGTCLFLAVGDTFVNIGEVGFVIGRWHTLVIWHRRSSSLFFNKDQLEVFLDGNVVFSAPILFPRHLEAAALARCNIGWDFNGQMSGIILLSGAADLNTMLSMLQGLAEEDLDTRDANTSSTPDPDLWVDPATVSSHERLKRSLLGEKFRIFAAYLPRRSMNGLCLDPHNGHHARLRGNRTHVWTKRTPQAVLQSIGGMPALLSLARQLLSRASRPHITGLSGHQVDLVLSAALTFMDGSVVNQVDFVRGGVAEVLELLLGCTSDRSFESVGAHTVKTLQDIYSVSLGHHAVQDPAVRRGSQQDGAHQVLRCLLANFHLWRRAPPDFQALLAVGVRKLAERSAVARHALTVGEVLTAIRICNPSDVSAQAATAVDSIKSSDSPKTATVGTRSEHGAMAQMKAALWGLLRSLISRELSQAAGDALVQFIASCDDMPLVSELIQTLDELMRRPAPPAGIFRVLDTASLMNAKSEHGSTRVQATFLVTGGFLPLLLLRCVLVEDPTEKLRVAGLHAANVFMARSSKERVGDADNLRASLQAEAGHTTLQRPAANIDAKVSTVFGLLSEGIVRDRHVLGENTYAALLEMALLAPEDEVKWDEQGSTIGLAKAAGPATMRKDIRSGDFRQEHRADDVKGALRSSDGGPKGEAIGVHDGLGGKEERESAAARDDARHIRNVLPLALILQCLPSMARPLQVRFHEDLLVMLKRNERNRQKLIESSHVHGQRFWGMWQRCLFLMAAPLFTRRGQDAALDDVTSDDLQEGDYMMVVELHAILLEHTLSFDAEGYRDIAFAASLQRLIPHGRTAARILLAQLAFEVYRGQRHPPPLDVFVDASDAGDAGSGAVSHVDAKDTRRRRRRLLLQRWDNIVNLAFIAANLVSDDLSTVTAGLFPAKTESPTVKTDDQIAGDSAGGAGEDAAMIASAAATSVPYSLCSQPAKHGRVALAARVIGMFEIETCESQTALLKLCAARSAIPGQGPLMFPLLRLGLFLLVHLHPLSIPARENASKLDMLIECLLGDAWNRQDGGRPVGSDDMCILVLAHVHAALMRLKVLATSMENYVHGRSFEEKDDITGGPTALHPLERQPTSRYSHARRVSEVLISVLSRIVGRCPDMLKSKLGERLTSVLQDAVEQTQSFPLEALSSKNDPRLNSEEVRQSAQGERRSGAFLCSAGVISVFSAPEAADVLDACMPSLQAADELESTAVRLSRERAQHWQDVVDRSIIPASVGDSRLGGYKVVEHLRQRALQAEALRSSDAQRRLLAARQKLGCLLRTLSAASCPWTTRSGRDGSHEPCGWEVSSHKDQRMRQMLLVPVDDDVGHKEASYDDSTGNVREADEPAIPDGSEALLPPRKRSTSLLSGAPESEEGDDDDDDEAVGHDVTSSWRALSFSAVDQVRRHSYSQTSLEANVHFGVVREAERGDLDPAFVSSSPGRLGDGPGERSSAHNTRGKWRVTNVLRQGSLPGTLSFSGETLVFESDPCPSDAALDESAEPKSTWRMRQSGQTWRWRLERLTQLHLRRFLLSPRAVELFWADSSEVFLAFEDVRGRQMFTRTLRKQQVPMLPATTQRGQLHPRKVLQASRLTDLWRRRQISNFQYIMELNVIAGRSYNDVTQYPVFPWVIADYVSSDLDLADSKSFRDLSKPIGALNEQRRQAFMERYATFEDDNVPKFMYGSHFSSAGVVLHYHVRQDPFTTLHIDLQGGRFDCPDRMFNDIERCWKGCIDANNMSDVKELTPEFFYFPEIFLNTNKLPLGQMQEGRGVVDDVQMPPWAKDAFDFVRVHRAALESEHVSRHLHNWIDLIFGFKQQGPEAVKAANVFYYLTYEGAVDLSQVDDALQRDAMETQIRHFGQTPSQVLLEPHPPRLPPEECVLPLFSPTSSLANLRAFSAKRSARDSVRATAALLVYCTDDRLVCVDASMRVTTWGWSGIPDGGGRPFTLGVCKSNTIKSRTLHISTVTGQTPLARLRVPFARSAASEEPTPALSMGRVHSCFALRAGSEGNADALLSCGYWDDVIRLHQVDGTLRLPLAGTGSGGHQDAIRCVCIADGGSLLVSGGQDATCRVWVVGNTSMAAALGDPLRAEDKSRGSPSVEAPMVCVNVLYGHEAPVTCLAVSEELDAVVSGASDGRLVLHCLKDGRYVRHYFLGEDSESEARRSRLEVSQLSFSCHGDVVAHSWTDLSLHRFSLNGRRLASATAPTAITCLLTAGGGEYLMAGSEDGLIRVYTMHNLCMVHAIDLENHGGITCMRLSSNSEYLLAGSEDGEVSIISDARRRLRMLDLAMRKAFLG